MTLTIEERERLAYITNSPVQPLLEFCLTAESNRTEELEHEIRQLKDELTATKEQAQELKEKVEEASGHVAYATERLQAELKNVERLCAGMR